MEQQGEPKRKLVAPTHAPMWITILAIVIATGCASALVYVLLNETTGPGEVLHAFYGAMDKGDCVEAGSFTNHLDQTGLCDAATAAKGNVPTDPSIDSVTLDGERGTSARIQVTEVAAGEPATWEMVLVEGEWRISRCPDVGVFAHAC